jgi:hypothetical protein
MYRMLRPLVVMVAKKIFREDAVIYGGVQQGMTASPHRGVIGTREERIFVFQEWVSRMCNGPRELPVLQPPLAGVGHDAG